MSIDPLKWMSIPSDERKTLPGSYLWSASFWKCISFSLVGVMVVLLSYLWGKTLSAAEVQNVVREDVKIEISSELKDVQQSLANIQAALQEQRLDDAKRDKKLDQLMLQPKYAPKD